MYLFLLILGSLIAVECQVCTKKVMSSRWVPQTFIKTYIENYRAQCWYGACTRTRLATYVDSKWVQKISVEDKQTCCEGYINVDDDELQDSIQCKPICIPACENGFCSEPGKCECNDGYYFAPESTNKCLPSCQMDCGRGHCSAPETCECDFGYVFQNRTCQPICNEPCINGTCIAPETCECNIGYRKLEDNTCAPYCSKGCTHGTCVSPEVCRCVDKFEKSGDECVPHCDNDCGFGNCTAPNKCTCHVGYKVDNGTCVPHCTASCDHGRCVAPNTCACDKGWSYNNNECQPICTVPCENGSCVAPDECECHTGYSRSENGSCTPYCADCDNGKCVAPDVCECNEGWSRNGSKCTPLCKKPCGPGSCVQPNECKCYPGYKQDMQATNSEICVPDCDLCNDTCVESNCICNYPCCTSVDCNRKLRSDGTTIEDSIIGSSYKADTNYPNTTSSLDYYTNDYDDTSIDNILTTDDEEIAKHTNDEYKGYPYWVYFLIMGLILVTPFTVFIMVFIGRRRIQSYFKGGSYKIDDRYPPCKDLAISQAMSGSLSSNISYSDIKNRKDNNYV